jgi:hypothetical protein
VFRRGQTASSEEERRKVTEALQAEMARRERGGYDAREGDEQQHTDQAKRRREAISAALVAQGDLS